MKLPRRRFLHLASGAAVLPAASHVAWAHSYPALVPAAWRNCTMLTKQAWSPYIAGIVIGLLQIPAFLLIETALGASTAYVTVGRMIASWIDPSIQVAVTSRNWWQVALVVGIAIGAFISMGLSGAERHPISPIWQRALASSSTAKRYVVAFVGGFLLLIGARIADGCTSGHGLSGMAQLAVGSTVAVAAMFAGGIATAMLVLRRI